MESDFCSAAWQDLTVAVVGMGLIGGSYAKALRKLGVKKIIGIDFNESVLRRALSKNIIDIAITRPEEILKEAQVVISSVYPNAVIEFVKEAVPYLNKKVLLTDATGIKGTLPEDVQALLTDEMEFLAGHPMAGRQGSGLEMSQSEIFLKSNYIIVQASHNSQAAIAWLEKFAMAIGCGKTVVLDAKEHDRIIAYTSNLPHILAVALINSASYSENTKYFIAGSFRDGTRVADINPYLWSDLFLANDKNVLKEIATIKEELTKWEAALQTRDENALQEMMKLSAQKRKDLY